MGRRHKRRTHPTVEETWPSRHRRLVVATLIALSIVLRVIYFTQLSATPFVDLHRWRQTDMNYYDDWARRIAAGDWRSVSVGVPMHRWHREIAQEYFAKHPDRRAELERTDARPGNAADADAALWAQWMRAPRFYQDPLYPYLVALTYRIAGADVRYVFAWQLAVGVLTNVLIWLLVRRFFGDVVAACAAALAVLSGPLMFYEMLLLRDSLVAFTGLGVIWIADRAMQRGTWRWLGALGLSLGAACALKSTFLVLGAGVMTIMLLVLRARGRGLLVPGAIALAGFAVAIAPLVARNVAVGAPPFSLATSGPLTFVASNDANARPDAGFGIDRTLLARFLGDTSGGWRPAIALTRASHGVGSYVSMLWRKWDRSWHWFEIPNNENFYYMRMQAPVLAWLPITFWLCAPLALAGLVIGARRVRDAWPLYLLAAASIAPMILFYVLGRFRAALFVAAIPFAALALAEILMSIRGRSRAKAVWIAVSVLLIGVWTGRPLASNQIQIRTADWILAYSVVYQDRVYGALDRKDWAAGGAAYLEFFERYEPSATLILASQDPQLAPELADMHQECSQILKMAGQGAAAEIQMERARQLLALGGRR